MTKRSAAALAGAVFILMGAPLVEAGSEYKQALPGYRYQFPRDHFSHPDFRTEWWYYTGNVTDSKGARFGFELVFFREGERHLTDAHSAWEVQELFLAHAAFTDAAGKRFWYEERLNRPGPGIAGVSFEKRRIWNGNWSVQWDGEVQRIEAVSDHFNFDLRLNPAKPFVIQGENGVDQKAEGVGHASHYVSFPLLDVSGSMNLSPVKGRAWMDHEWFTSELAENQSGWDWFSIQLDNGTELMLYELRRKDGTVDPYSSGTYIDKAGIARHLSQSDFAVLPLSHWHKYPIAWRISVPPLGIALISHAVLSDQELKGKKGGPSYWEGAVDYSGTQSGVGYIEMTGYDQALRLE